VFIVRERFLVEILEGLVTITLSIIGRTSISLKTGTRFVKLLRKFENLASGVLSLAFLKSYTLLLLINEKLLIKH
jgi:hypothetical protein